MDSIHSARGHVCNVQGSGVLDSIPSAGVRCGMYRRQGSGACNIHIV